MADERPQSPFGDKCVSPKKPGVGKRKYRSKAAAMKFVRRSSGRIRSASRAYLCRRCGWWHLTTQKPRTRP